MENPVSLQQIALHLGVSKGTVSLALRNHTRISAATRARVHEVARVLGYRPNPAVAAWMSHRRRVAPKTSGESIVFLNSWPDPDEWRRSPWFTRFEDGVRTRAKQLGFGFEAIWLGEPGMTAQRISNILRARGVRGLVIGSLPDRGYGLDLDWQNFSAVSESLTLLRPEISCSVCDYSHAMQLALYELALRGYRRIGYASASVLESRTQRLYLSAYLGFHHDRPEHDCPPPLDWTTKSQDALRRWIRDWKPDAIVSHDVAMQDAVRKLGIRVPDSIGVAALCIHPGVSPCGVAGIDHQFERCGEVAVDLLVSQLHHNEIGPPAQPILALTRGVWVEGADVRSPVSIL